MLLFFLHSAASPKTSTKNPHKICKIRVAEWFTALFSTTPYSPKICNITYIIGEIYKLFNIKIKGIVNDKYLKFNYVCNALLPCTLVFGNEVEQ